MPRVQYGLNDEIGKATASYEINGIQKINKKFESVNNTYKRKLKK